MAAGLLAGAAAAGLELAGLDVVLDVDVLEPLEQAAASRPIPAAAAALALHGVMVIPFETPRPAVPAVTCTASQTSSRRRVCSPTDQ